MTGHLTAASDQAGPLAERLKRSRARLQAGARSDAPVAVPAPADRFQPFPLSDMQHA